MPPGSSPVIPCVRKPRDSIPAQRPGERDFRGDGGCPYGRSSRERQTGRARRSILATVTRGGPAHRWLHPGNTSRRGAESAEKSCLVLDSKLAPLRENLSPTVRALAVAGDRRECQSRRRRLRRWRQTGMSVLLVAGWRNCSRRGWLSVVRLFWLDELKFTNQKRGLPCERAGVPARSFTHRAAVKAMGIGAMAAAGVGPMVLADDKAVSPAPVVGEGKFKYECLHGWAQRPDGMQFGNTHMVQEDAQGRIIIHHQGGSGGQTGSICIFDADGKFIKAWGQKWSPGAHGMQLRKENGTEFSTWRPPGRGRLSRPRSTARSCLCSGIQRMRRTRAAMPAIPTARDLCRRTSRSAPTAISTLPMAMARACPPVQHQGGVHPHLGRRRERRWQAELPARDLARQPGQGEPRSRRGRPFQQAHLR